MEVLKMKIVKAITMTAFAAAAVIALISATTAYAGTPEDILKVSLNKGLEVLKNKELAVPEKSALRRKSLREIADKIFDFEEMSRRTLAVHWNQRSKEEQAEFVILFKDFLEGVYIGKIEKYGDEDIRYLAENVEGEYSIVKTNVINKENLSIPIDYKLIARNSDWKVYDVVIEGVSLVNNYRNQFNQIIRTKSYHELVKMLKEKQAIPLGNR
jgi:phospholipid transport system substrate-binding protein